VIKVTGANKEFVGEEAPGFIRAMVLPFIA